MAINTAEDVIRVIHDNPGLIARVLSESPEALAEARRIILTDEVLALPGRFNRMLDVQNETLREVRQLNGRVERLEDQGRRLEDQGHSTDSRVGRLEDLALSTDSRVGRLEDLALSTDSRVGRLEDLALSTDSRVGRLEDLALSTDSRVSRVEDLALSTDSRVGRLEDLALSIDSKLGHLIGSELERRLAVIVPHRLRGRFNVEVSQILVYQDRDPVVSPDFLIRIDEARDAGLISAEQHRRIRLTDMVVQARPRQDGDDIYFAIEAGATLENRDIDRAMTSSELIGAVLSGEVIPLTVAYTIPDDVRRYNEEEKEGRVNILRVRRRN